jgi:hypothetical protein
METLAITLSEETTRKLKTWAEAVNLSPEQLVSSAIEEWLQRPRDAFARAAEYVLLKNAVIYGRLGELESGAWHDS